MVGRDLRLLRGLLRLDCVSLSLLGLAIGFRSLGLRLLDLLRRRTAS
jgi:hypothetical protein